MEVFLRVDKFDWFAFGFLAETTTTYFQNCHLQIRSGSLRMPHSSDSEADPASDPASDADNAAARFDDVDHVESLTSFVDVLLTSSSSSLESLELDSE